MAEDILTTRPGTYQQDFLQSFLSLSFMVKWMTDANNASNVISEVKRTPLAAMTQPLISTYITAVDSKSISFCSLPAKLRDSRNSVMCGPNDRLIF